MDCAEVQISVHAFKRFDDRGFIASDIRTALRTGKIIEEYPDDKPWPSCLVLGIIGERYVHIVVARDEESKVCRVVTAYEPEEAKWGPDEVSRRADKAVENGAEIEILKYAA